MEPKPDHLAHPKWLGITGYLMVAALLVAVAGITLPYYLPPSKVVQSQENKPDSIVPRVPTVQQNLAISPSPSEDSQPKEILPETAPPRPVPLPGNSPFYHTSPTSGHQYTMADRIRYQLWDYTWKPDADKPISRIEVRISDQIIYVFQENKIVAQSPVSTGMPGHETPSGSHSITEKNISRKSIEDGVFLNADGNIVAQAKVGQSPPSGEVFEGAEMPYYMRIAKDGDHVDGMGLFAGYLPGFPASDDGCIRLPHAFAELLFSNVTVGTPIDVVP
jgi:lipoprotein-anchoring transpeptidase ErfK/SrfK